MTWRAKTGVLYTLHEDKKQLQSIRGSSSRLCKGPVAGRRGLRIGKNQSLQHLGSRPASRVLRGKGRGVLQANPLGETGCVSF